MGRRIYDYNIFLVMFMVLAALLLTYCISKHGVCQEPVAEPAFPMFWREINCQKLEIDGEWQNICAEETHTVLEVVWDDRQVQ